LLIGEEKLGFLRTRGLFCFGVTPYYALLADRVDPSCPIRRQIVPRPEEADYRIGELPDPLGEEPREVVPNLIHRYPDRALLLSTDRCPVYCRFCTRRRIVGRTERQATRSLLAEAFDYVRATPSIREVIVSGGDALMLGDQQIDHILSELRSAPHVDIIRIATRMPVTCPMRVTDALVRVLKRWSPVFVMTHFNHPKEHTAASEEACARLVDAGMPVYNQSVLLKGVNDDVDVIRDLNRRLVFMRITPYYLHQCDMAQGIEHFRTPLSTGVSIIDGLRGHVSGLMVPQLCVDVPGGFGKVTVVPEWIVKREGRSITFRTYSGDTAEYLDPREME
jgi:lysine 2,3-aminomutase